MDQIESDDDGHGHAFEADMLQNDETSSEAEMSNNQNDDLSENSNDGTDSIASPSHPLDGLLDREAVESGNSSSDDDGYNSSICSYGGNHMFDHDDKYSVFTAGGDWYDDNCSDDSWDIQVQVDPFFGGRFSISYPSMEKRDREYEQFLEAGFDESFPRFAMLPVELRLHIWELHCPRIHRRNRMLQVYIMLDGRLVPGVIMAQQTHAIRRFMRISRETRAIGVRALPDVLRVGATKHDDAVFRFNAQSDLIHIIGEGLPLPLAAGTTPRPGDYVQPYDNVRNLVLHMAGRRRDLNLEWPPQELRHPDVGKAFELLFPNLENFYVSEPGDLRYVDRWVGHARSYQRYHIRVSEDGEADLESVPIEGLYCWHEPQSHQRRRGLGGPLNPVSAPKLTGDSEDVGNAREADGDDERHGENSEDVEFEDECAVDCFTLMRERGVRFSRLLMFEDDGGMKDYYVLRHYCGPLGTWPNEEERNKEPLKSMILAIALGDAASDSADEFDGDGYMVEEGDDDWISDDLASVDEDGEDDGNNDDGDDVMGALDSEDEYHAPPPLAAMFSSPEPESELEADGGAVNSGAAGRARKRRIVDDSDDNEDGGGGQNDDGDHNLDSAGESTNHQSRRKRRRAAILSSSDDEDGDASVQASSHTEIGDEEDENEDEDDEDSSNNSDSDDDEPPKKTMTLAERLQMHRRQNPVSDDETSDSDKGSEDEETQDYAGDYGEGERYDDDEGEDDY